MTIRFTDKFLFRFVMIVGVSDVAFALYCLGASTGGWLK